MQYLDNKNFTGIPDKITVGIDSLANYTKSDINHLHNKEHEQYRSLQNEKRRREFIASRLLIKKIALRSGIQDIYVANESGTGAPRGFSGSNKIPVSISHCKEAVCCAISQNRRNIGIDIERKDRNIDIRVRERILHPDEKIALLEIPDMKLWTLKEAVVKLIKTGLRKNLNELPLRRYQKDRYRVEINENRQAAVVIIPHKIYFIALAYYLD